MKWEAELKGYTCNDCFLSMQNCHDKSICCEDETGLCDYFEKIGAQMDKKTFKLNGAGEITEVKHEAGPWPCDPLRNRDCTKVNCYLRGGECRLTYKQECRREESE